MTLYAEIDPDLPNKIRLEGPFKFKEKLNTVPGTVFSSPRALDGSGKLPQQWRVSLTWQSCLALRTTFAEDLEVGPNLAAWSRDYRARIIDPAMAMRVSTSAPGYPNLFEYQRAGVQFMAITGRALLTDGMGAGKTRQAFSTIRLLHEMGRQVFPVLIVAPNSTLLSWKREIDIVWPGLKVNVIKGPMGARRKLLDEPAHVYIINWEGLRTHSRLAPYGNVAIRKCTECGGVNPDITATQCQAHIRELNKMEFGSVIGDEIHRAKDGKSQQTRALKAATGSADIRLALSGTPISSSPEDLWSPLNWLLPEAYPSKTKYVDRFLDLMFNAWGQQTVIGVKKHMEPEFYGGLDPHLRHMPKDLVLSFLPPVIYERRDVEMAAKQKKAYNQMRDKMVAEIEHPEKADDMMIVKSPLIKMIRLLQFASSYAEVEWVQEMAWTTNELTGERVKKLVDKQKVTLSDPSCKLDAFMDDIDDFGGESVVVFAVSSQLINMLSKRLTKAKIEHGLITGAQTVDERQQHMDDFQSGKTKFILCTIAAGGTGITLTKGSTAVFLQRSWSMIENLQAEARVHRIGSEIHDFVKIVDYVTDGSVEETVAAAVEKKGEQLEKILRSKDLLKQMLTENEIDLDEPELANIVIDVPLRELPEDEIA